MAAACEVLAAEWLAEFEICHAIEKIGLWKYLENEFIKNGKTSVFHKKAVKICTYSSKFGGGNNAMKQAILDYFEKRLD